MPSAPELRRMPHVRGAASDAAWRAVGPAPAGHNAHGEGAVAGALSLSETLTPYSSSARLIEIRAPASCISRTASEHGHSRPSGPPLSFQHGRAGHIRPVFTQFRARSAAARRHPCPGRPTRDRRPCRAGRLPGPDRPKGRADRPRLARGDRRGGQPDGADRRAAQGARPVGRRPGLDPDRAARRLPPGRRRRPGPKRAAPGPARAGGAAVRQPRRRPGAGLVCRRRSRRHHHRAQPRSGASQ